MDQLKKAFTGLVYDVSEPLWPVRYPDGDWEELKSQEMKTGRHIFADTSLLSPYKLIIHPKKK